MDWRHEAACRDEDPELFFPIGNTGPALVQIEEAKAVCRRCPVVDDCLRWALETGQDSGRLGWAQRSERRALKRRNARCERGHPLKSRITPVERDFQCNDRADRDTIDGFVWLNSRLTVEFADD